MNPNELIGKKFRRNVYGLSIWEDTIESVWISLHLINTKTKGITLMVKGSVRSFPVTEIVLTGESLNWMEKAQLEKRAGFSRTDPGDNKIENLGWMSANELRKRYD